MGVVLAGGLSACSSVSDVVTPVERGIASAPEASTGAPAAPMFDPRDFAITGTCPKVFIQNGAETMLLFEPGKQGDPQAIRFQATLTQTARECSLVGDKTLIKVGMAGRVLSGPKGSTGAITLPVRVAVRSGETVLYSGLHQVPVSVNAPDYAAAWSKIDEMVAIPATSADEAQIYVGFDEAGSKGTPAKKKK